MRIGLKMYLRTLIAGGLRSGSGRLVFGTGSWQVLSSLVSFLGSSGRVIHPIGVEVRPFKKRGTRISENIPTASTAAENCQRTMFYELGA